MGFLSWLGNKIGGPETIAKSLHNVFRRYEAAGHSFQESVELAVRQRYSIIKAASDKDILSLHLLATENDLGAMSFFVYTAENKIGAHYNMFSALDAIRDYFMRVDPRHAPGAIKIKRQIEDEISGK